MGFPPLPPLIPAVEQNGLKAYIDATGTGFGGTTIPASPAPFQELTIGTVRGATGATSQGYRKAILAFVDKATTANDTAVISVDQVFIGVQITDGAITGTTTLATSNPVFIPAMTGNIAIGTGIPAGTTVTYVDAFTLTLSAASTNATGLTVDINPLIKTTGVHSKLYTPGDNGGDTSAGLFVQTGGGGALTAYKLCGLRPAGLPDRFASPQGAIEAGTDGGSQAILALAGATGFGGGTHTSQSLYARIDNAVSEGVLVAPGNGTFDSRIAYAVGTKTNDAASTNLKFKVLLDGTVQAVTGKIFGAGQNSDQPTTASSLGGSLVLQDSQGAAASGAMLILGAQQGLFAAIKGHLINGGTNTTGDLQFFTRNAIADATLTERIRVKSGGDVVYNGSGLTISATGHVVGAVPTGGTITVANGAGIGTSPGSPTISGSDVGGSVTFTTGTSPTADGVLVTVTFGFAYGTAPKAVVVSSGSAVTATAVPWTGPGDIGTGTFSIRLHAPVNATAYTVFYQVVG